MRDSYRAALTAVPRDTLYHYTSLDRLKEIVARRVLWASKIPYREFSVASGAHDAVLLDEVIGQKKAGIWSGLKRLSNA